MSIYAAGRNETSLPVFHFDMYRVTDEDSLDSIGFYDYFARGGFIVTEWSENIRGLCQRNILK